MTAGLFTEAGIPLSTLRYTNEGADTFRWVPDRFRLRFDPLPDEVSGSLELPPGWRALPGDGSGWLVFPRGLPRFPVQVRLVRRADGPKRVVACVELPVVFEGYNRFDPRRHRLPWANRLDELGVIEPAFRHFQRTFCFAIAPRLFFRQLYRDVVALRPGESGGVIGGLCTGLSRVALARALERVPELDDGALREWAIVLHGRQLSDRALLAGLPWFLWPSPRRAYRAFVDDLLQRGWSDRCFDLNVPRPWRRDVLSALLGQGHTVVPYAFQQSEATRAQVRVYDPNLPDRAEETVVTFDLQRDRYEYPPLGVDGARTTVVAVPTTAYLAGRSAILASLASPLLRRPRWSLVGLTGSALLLLGAFLWRWRVRRL